MAASLVFLTAGSWGLHAANVGHSEKETELLQNTFMATL